MHQQGWSAARSAPPAARLLSVISTRLVDGRHWFEDAKFLVVDEDASGNQCWSFDEARPAPPLLLCALRR